MPALTTWDIWHLLDSRLVSLSTGRTAWNFVRLGTCDAPSVDLLSVARMKWREAGKSARSSQILKYTQVCRLAATC